MTVGEAEEAVSAAVTVGPAVVGFAGALPPAHLTHQALRAVHVAVAGRAARVTIETNVALIAVETGVLRSTLAPPGTLLTLARRVGRIALTTWAPSGEVVMFTVMCHYHRSSGA